MRTPRLRTAGKSFAKSVGLFFFVRIQSSMKLAALGYEANVSKACINFKFGSVVSSSSPSLFDFGFRKGFYSWC